MSIENIIERTGLHDATVRSMQLHYNHFSAQIDNILIDIDSDDSYSVTIDMTVQSVTRDGEIVDTLRLEAEGSSIIQFERSGNLATLVMDWRDYTARTNVTRAYSFIFDTFNLRVVSKQ